MIYLKIHFHDRLMQKFLKITLSYFLWQAFYHVLKIFYIVCLLVSVCVCVCECVCVCVPVIHTSSFPCSILTYLPFLLTFPFNLFLLNPFFLLFYHPPAFKPLTFGTGENMVSQKLHIFWIYLILIFLLFNLVFSVRSS